MNKVKRLLAFLLAGVMLLAAGCGDKPDGESSAPISDGSDGPGNTTGSTTDGGEDSSTTDGTTDTTGNGTGDPSGTTGTTGGNKPTGNNTTSGTKTPTSATTSKTTQKQEESNVNFNAMYMGNIKECGVVGDGKTDDTEAIQTVLNAWPKGCTIYFPAGTYLITEPLKVKDGIHLVGEPAKNGIGGATIKAGKSMDYLIGCHDDSVRFNASIIMNLTFDGGKKEGYKLESLLDMPGFCSMKLANLKLQNCTGNGIWTYQGKANNPTWISTAENIEVTNVDGYAMYMINSDTAYNHITIDGGKGFMDFNYGGNVYNDIHISNCNGSGLTIGRENYNENGHISIMNSTFKNNAGYGLQLNRSSAGEKRVQVEGCDFSGNGLGDVGVKNVERATFYNNNFRSKVAFGGANSASGIQLVANNFACKKIGASGFMMSADNKFEVTSFKDKGCALDVDRYDYAKVYKAAALQCESGRVVDVADFGASASAYDDNSEAFQAAIDALGSKGGIVYVSKGNYGIGKKVTIPSNVSIVGEGNNNTVGYAPVGDIDTMFEIKKGATNVLFMNGNIVNPTGQKVKYFIKGDSLKNCQFESVEGNSNVVSGYEYVVYLSNSSNCSFNAMVCGVGDGGTMNYLKDCKNCVVQTGYISRGSWGTVVDGGSGHIMFNNHYDWFYKSAVEFKNGAKNCTFANNYCDINQRVVTLNYDKVTDANITISTFISRESGIPARSKLVDNGADRRELAEIYLKNAKNVKIISCSSDIWGYGSATNKNILELAGTNNGIQMYGCICGGLYPKSQASAFGGDSVEDTNLVY